MFYANARPMLGVSDDRRGTGAACLCSWRRRVVALVGALASSAVVGCAAGHEAGAPASVFKDQDVPTAAQRFHFLLGDEPDESVLADARSLVFDVPISEDLDLGNKKIIIEYLGEGNVAPMIEEGDDGPVVFQPEEEDDADVDLPEEDPTVASFVGINGASRNQFLISVPRELILDLAAPSFDAGSDASVDAGHGDHDDEAAPGIGLPPAPTNSPSQTHGPAIPHGGGYGAELDPAAGWSNAYDSRDRIYGLNASVGGVNRWQTDFGSCSGSLVGPRHMLTAGHCLYQASTWSTNFTVRVGRNGSSSQATVVCNPSNVPAGEVLWYFVPQGWIDTEHRQYDMGIVTLPADVGGSGAGQAGCYQGQCWFGYASYTNTTMSSLTWGRRGYPVCDPTFTSGGTARIDEPCQTGAWAGSQACTTEPCDANHLYGEAGSCTTADYGWPDPDGWDRTLYHNCDASAGDSGSPMYRYSDGLAAWVVGSVQTGQRCGITSVCPDEPANELTRPLRDTRLTPEYVGFITYFRNLYP